MLDLKVAIQGSLKEEMRRQQKLIDRAATQAVKATARGLRREIKRQADRAGLGRLGNTVGVLFFPRRGNSLRILGVVKSRAKVHRRSGKHDLLELFDQGVTIRAAAGRWLAIPTKLAPFAARGSERSRAAPRFAGFKLRFVPTNNPKLARLVRADRPDEVLYWLVKQVRIPKTLDIRAAENKWRTKLKPRVLSRLDKLSKKSGLDF